MKARHDPRVHTTNARVESRKQTLIAAPPVHELEPDRRSPPIAMGRLDPHQNLHRLLVDRDYDRALRRSQIGVAYAVRLRCELRVRSFLGAQSFVRESTIFAR
jgi:hypothetical protein